MANSAEISVTLAGQPLNVLPGWLDVEVLATFDSGEVQGNITTDSFQFILEGYTRLKQAIADGLTGGAGIFEPVPITIEAVSDLGTYSAFEGGVRLVDARIDDVNGIIEAPLQKFSNVRTLDENLSGLSFLYLYEIGVILDSDFVDVDYVVDKPDKVVDALIAQITLYLMLQELANQIRVIADQAAKVAGLLAAGVTGSIGSAIYAVAAIVINVAYAATILVLVIDLGTKVVQSFTLPVRTHKGILLKTLLEKASQHLGWGFNTSISELDNIVYLPSNTALDEEDAQTGLFSSPGVIEQGIPKANDYGYLASEAFQLARNLFNARYQVIGGVVEMHREYAPYWRRLATYTLPDILDSPYRYNTDRLKDSVFIKFQTDLSDRWTIDPYQGNAFQVITSAITIGPSGQDNIEGLTEVNIPCALGLRKEKLNGLEKVIRVVAKAVDSVVNVFGGNSNLEGNINSKIGVLKVSTNNHAVPKLLYMQDNRLPANHRDLLSAKVLWERFHFTRSLVENGFERQARIYEEVEIPFGFADFLQVIENSFCTTFDGKQAKINRLVWNMARDKAIIDYEVQEIYTRNLQETGIEPTSNGAIVS